MANYTTTVMAVILPTANRRKFGDYFKGSSEKFFNRTALLSCEEIDSRNGLSLMQYCLECAWNVDHCMVHPTDTFDTTITLKEACLECDVRKLSIWSEEPGCAFFEYINYDKGDDDVQCLDAERPRQPNDLYLDDESLEGAENGSKYA